MQLRNYQSEDASQLARLFYETVHHINAKDYTPAQLNAWATGQVNLDQWHHSFLTHDTMVATDNGIIVGFGDMDETGYLDRLFVHKDYQRQGIATAICDALERRSPKNHFTTHASLTAQGFFVQRGYRIVQKLSVQRNGIALTTLLMEKTAK